MTSKNIRQFLIKTLECVMMAATNHSSLNKSKLLLFIHYFCWKPVLLGLSRREKRRVRGYARKVSSLFHMLCKEGLALKGVKSQEVFEKW